MTRGRTPAVVGLFALLLTGCAARVTTTVAPEPSRPPPSPPLTVQELVAQTPGLREAILEVEAFLDRLARREMENFQSHGQLCAGSATPQKMEQLAEPGPGPLTSYTVQPADVDRGWDKQCLKDELLPGQRVLFQVHATNQNGVELDLVAHRIVGHYELSIFKHGHVVAHTLTIDPAFTEGVAPFAR